ncbi:hypothetical protein [Gloeocapsopsis sp. IPPAS B-1203]|uniref:DUF6887 family protein n=1 Tax=Gloeocapsopsis sp. IPPAS B-1203 TaxID=2049454 RepID=UPI000C187D56|nr:hypothetical protein [Gloeocapsopsis sp. IPPAS B-1203]PIG92814.1 hypothetical protein CSQ79_14670 [Gloeocapsopsis sp. IPPAS B-1203]
MNKPNFKEMSRAELRAYIIATHDDEAIYELFVNRRDPNAKKYPAPLDEAGIKIMEEAFRRKIQGEPEL